MTSLHPLQTPFEATTHATFDALMWAFAHPGEVQILPNGEPCLHIAEALLDLETSFFTPNKTLLASIRLTGARERAASEAEFHFYPHFDTTHLEFVRQARRGNLLYPDSSATLIIGCTFGSGGRLRLSGPGIEIARELEIGRLPEGFWQAREAARRYPLGWDVLLVSGSQVIGVPRSTELEIIAEVA